jgi:hypothetical protein
LGALGVVWFCGSWTRNPDPGNAHR